MRIACISTSKVPGTTANAMQLMKACEALVRLGHHIQLWLPDFGGEGDWNLLSKMYGLSLEFPLVRLPVIESLRRYDFCWKAVGEAERWGADLLYVWPLQAAALSSQRRLPTLLEMHDRPRGLLGPWLFQMFLEGQGAVRLLTTTDALQRALMSGSRPERVSELAVPAPNGVDIERYRDLPAPAAARRQLDLEARFTVVYTGHLYAGRGAPLMYALAKENPDITFLWAGGEEAAVAHWRARAAAEGVENLRLLGFVPNAELPLVQAAGDLLMMPYEERIAVSSGLDAGEYASPMKVFEYLAAGRPILSSDLAVLREILDESTAVLLPPRRLDAWQRAVTDLRQDSARRSELGRRARERAKEFTWTARAERALASLNEASDV